jgi:hypothetical protein
MPSPTHTCLSEPSGTPAGLDNNVSVQHVSDASYIQDSEHATPTDGVPALTEENNVDGRDQALESHEVIELQIFSEKKAWIQEKIKVSVLNCRKFHD